MHIVRVRLLNIFKIVQKKIKSYEKTYSSCNSSIYLICINMEYINKVEYYKYWLSQPQIPRLVLEEFKIDLERYESNNQKN